ncbi:MAG: phospho-N-acetylmuramoyl-pentapeptide-transferase [Eubacteriales bacterium]|nr:phospho-N-acetylmuramoyl-pentapeptide-transferase [Eubacteriales bacterium]
MSRYAYFIATLLLSFLLTAAAARILIPKLKSHKMGQKILDIGPRWHKSKEGTPTMGGLSFVFASIVAALTAGLYGYFTYDSGTGLMLALTLVMAYLNGLIGFLDDYVKFIKKRNEGLRAGQKYMLQLIVAGGYLASMRLTGFLDTSLYIPYAQITVELGILYYVFALVLITGVVNSVNLTDGIDGLASTVTFFTAAFFSLAAFAAGAWETVFLSAMTAGICLGFLVYNFYPARIFMGDTGSLFLGGLVVGAAFMLNNPLIVIAAGFVYIIESISVIIQVIYFKITRGKRFFRMAPFHHHLEKCGWSELKIVGVSGAVTVCMCTVAFFGL